MRVTTRWRLAGLAFDAFAGGCALMVVLCLVNLDPVSAAFEVVATVTAATIGSDFSARSRRETDKVGRLGLPPGEP